MFIWTFGHFTVNPDNTVGAVGFTTRLVPSLYPITLIKVDEQTGEHVRDRNGVCVKAQPGTIFYLTHQGR